MKKRKDAQEEPEQEEQEDSELQARIDELQESLARTQADYANYRRRTEEQREETKKRANEEVITEILQVLDNLELAINQAPENERGSFHKGVELVLAQLMSALENHGVERIATDEFDPRVHEGLLKEENDSPKGTIIEVLQPGYSLGGKVLRTAKVKLSAGRTEEEQ